MRTRSRLRTTLPGLLACTILLVSAVACQQQATTPPTTPTSPTAAVIGGHKITESDIDDAIRALPDSMHVSLSDTQLRARILQVMIRRQALSQQALTLHLEQDPQIHHRIVKARNDILIESLQQWKKDHLPAPDEATIENYYQNHLAEFTIPEQVHARHILLGSEKQAKQVLALLHKGKDFATLAAEYSRDDSTKSRGGDLNWFPRGVMVKSFEDAVFAMKKPGDITGPVKTPFGWHIIQLIGKRPAVRQTLDEAKENIVATLQEKALDAWVKEVTKNAGEKIINPQYANPTDESSR